jgi:hypothetical protein
MCVAVFLTALLTACTSPSGSVEPSTVSGGGPTTEPPTPGSAEPSGPARSLADGPVAPGAYVIEPPPDGWAACDPWVHECPPEPAHARTLRVRIDIPEGWEAGLGATVVVPLGLDRGSSEGPDGAGLVIGWTTPTGGLHADPCQQISHLEPDIQPGPTVGDFIHAVRKHLPHETSDPVGAELGGYRGRYFELTGPADISGCRDWRPFEPGIVAQGPENLWNVWVINVDGLRMIILTETFPGTPSDVKAQLTSMVGSIRFLP